MTHLLRINFITNILFWEEKGIGLITGVYNYLIKILKNKNY